MKSSPYVGWFRHAPPSRVSKASAVALEALGRLSSENSGTNNNGKTEPPASSSMLLDKSLTISEAVRMTRNGSRYHYYVDGRLRGGNPNHEENGCGEGIFSFDDEGDSGSGSSGDKTPRLTHFDHHRIFDSIHQSASTRGLHFNDFTQDENDDDDDDEPHRSSSDLRRSLSEVFDSSDDDRGTQEDDGDLPGSPSAAIGVMNRLAHWFLFPLAHDSSGRPPSPYRHRDFEGSSSSSSAADELYGHVGPGATTALLPLFSGMLRRALILEDGGEAASDLGLRAIPPHSRGEAEEKGGGGEEEEGHYSPSEVGSHEGGAASRSSEDETSSSERRDESSSSSDRRRASSSASRLLDVSVSSLAEAYYAHQASREFLEAAETAGSSSPPPSLSSSPTTGHDEYGHHHPLDYVITQIDIARMVRNASRHLDVESILGLPTITYEGKKKKKKGGGLTSKVHTSGDDDEEHRQRVAGKEGPRLAGGPNAAGGPESGSDDFAWSWMIVPQDPEDSQQDAAGSEEGKSPSPQDARKAPTAAQRGEGMEGAIDDNRYDDDDDDSSPEEEECDENEHCVICLDHFVEGDRLRVLPCSHLFHAGCIDRWLSGAASDEECFTAGCPTCKERPVAAAPLSSSLDGSVPRWAFARLGDAMAGKGGARWSNSAAR